MDKEASLYERVKKHLQHRPYGSHFGDIANALQMENSGRSAEKTFASQSTANDAYRQLINRTLRDALNRKHKEISYLPLQNAGSAVKTGVYILDSVVRPENVSDIIHHVKHCVRENKKQNFDSRQPALEALLYELAGAAPPSCPKIAFQSVASSQCPQISTQPKQVRPPQSLLQHPNRPLGKPTQQSIIKQSGIASAALLSRTLSEVFEQAAADYLAINQLAIRPPTSPFTETRIQRLLQESPQPENVVLQLRGVISPYLKMYTALEATGLTLDEPAEECLYQGLVEGHSAQDIFADLLQ